MSSFPKIIIIYNPNSTGPSESNARKLATRLQKHLPSTTDIDIVATEHAGHAETIVKKYAKDTRPTLLISSSGDGGYHEMINGVIEGDISHIVTGLLPSGNANDHYNAVHHGDTVRRIVSRDTTRIDVLRVDATMHGKPWHRYAHSYAGIGLSPQIGKKLTAAKLNPFNEVWLVVKHLFTFNSVKLRVGNDIRRYDSLIFSNIGRMSKVLSLSDDASITDGKFEVTGKRSRSLSSLLGYFFKAATTGIDTAQHYEFYEFTCLKPTMMQLDGEVYQFEQDTTVTVTCAAAKLPCII